MIRDNGAWQTAMDVAYAGWKDGRRYGEFVADLDGRTRVAVLLGNLNYQVGNGGFRQWVDNGYGCSARDVLRAIRAVADAPTTTAAERSVGDGLWARVDELRAYIIPDAVNRGFFGNYWVDDSDNYGGDDPEGTEDWGGAELADGMDDWYYANQDVWHAAVERYLGGR